MKGLRWFHAVAAAIVLVAIGAAITVALRRPTERSAIITEPWSEMANQVWLKGNLVDARLVIPDRPHTREEADAHRDGTSRIARVRRFGVHTNAAHLRMGPLAAKPAGRLRIAAVGDSVTFGWGLTPEASWVTLLEADLRRRGLDVEVLNVGAPGAPVAAMGAWCRTQARKLAVDRVIWTRRLPPPPMGGVQGFVQGVRDCEAATGAAPVVFLPPISRFDLHGNKVGGAEGDQVRALLGPGYVVTDLTEAFRAAQGQHGETLVQQGGELAVVDLDTGKTWLRTPAPADDQLPAAVSALFEAEPQVAEALIYDGGHPDEAGSVVMAKLIADAVAPGL